MHRNPNIAAFLLNMASLLSIAGVSCSSPDGNGQRIDQKGTRYAFGRCSASPDGSTIIFAALDAPYLAPGVASDIFRVGTDGSALTQLTRSSICYSPWFSPDGRSIVYISASSGEQGCHVCVMDNDGRNLRQVTFGDNIDGTPSYSRDGSKIIFTRSARYRPYSMGGWISDNWDIWEMNAGGSSMRQLTFARYYSIDPPYLSPDGKHALFGACPAFSPSQNVNPMDVLYSLDISVDGSATNLRPVPLAASQPNLEYDGDPSFSLDGFTIVFSSLRDSRPSPYDYEVWTAGIDGTNLRQITHNRFRSLYPIFSPDGKAVYYWMPDGLWRMAADGSNAKRLAPYSFRY
jgi:Tol biopolymer transport system component